MQRHRNYRDASDQHHPPPPSPPPSSWSHCGSCSCCPPLLETTPATTGTHDRPPLAFCARVGHPPLDLLPACWTLRRQGPPPPLRFAVVAAWCCCQRARCRRRRRRPQAAPSAGGPPFPAPYFVLGYGALRWRETPPPRCDRQPGAAASAAAAAAGVFDSFELPIQDGCPPPRPTICWRGIALAGDEAPRCDRRFWQPGATASAAAAAPDVVSRFRLPLHGGCPSPLPTTCWRGAAGAGARPFV